MCLYSVQRPRSWACSAIGPAAGISSPSYSSTVSPLTRTRHVAVFHPKLEQPPLLGLDPGIQRALERVERPGGIVRTLHVVKLDLVAPARQAPAGAAEHDAGVVMPDVPDVHLQLEIAERLVGGEVAVAIAVRARRRAPGRSACRSGRATWPDPARSRTAASTTPSTATRARAARGTGSGTTATRAPGSRGGAGAASPAPSRRRGLESPRRWSTPADAASPSGCGTYSTRPCSSRSP